MFSKEVVFSPHLIFSVAVVLLCLTCATTQGYPPFECFAVSDLVRIFEDGYNCPEPQSRKGRLAAEALEIFGVRNEHVSAQCVITANQDIGHVTVLVSPLVHVKRSVSLPRDAIRWNFVGSIPIVENTPKYRKTDLVRPAPARFPDYLAEEKEVYIKKGNYRAVYLTVRIPRNAQAGDYEGAVTIKTERGDKSLPLHLTVYPLTLPDERHLMVTEWYTTRSFRKFHDIDTSDSVRFYEMLKVYAENMAEHRQNVFRVSLELITSEQGANGRLKFDFSRFDKWADVFWNTERMDLLETGFVARFGEGGWSSKEIVLRDFRVRKESTNQAITIPGKEFLPQFLPALENHLREKGWLEHATVGNDCAIDLYGWAEPGTRIVVHGRKLPVSEDGLFMENVRLSRDNTIVVEAEHKKGKKTIVRSFEVLY